MSRLQRDHAAVVGAVFLLLVAAVSLLAPVIAPAGVAACRGSFCVGAVGSPGAREEIRAMLSALGWREPEEWCAVA